MVNVKLLEVNSGFILKEISFKVRFISKTYINKTVIIAYFKESDKNYYDYNLKKRNYNYNKLNNSSIQLC